MKNDSFKTIGDQLKKADSVLIVTHYNMDGDAVGSAAAICHVLRRMGKESWILIEDEVPGNLQFLDRDYTTFDQDVLGEPDVSMCVDCGDLTRFPKRADRFMTGKVHICVDHHKTSEPFCDYNYIDPGAAATGELVYQLIRAMGEEVDKEAGEALFAAITTDTGNFQYSNTTRQSHDIAADLYDCGIDANGVSVEIYETVHLAKLKVQARAMENLELFADGKVAMSYLTLKMREECGAAPDETDGIVSELRSIDGVEVAVFIKETEDEGRIRVSLRSKKDYDVARVAAAFEGGGHTKAAGCTYYGTLEDARRDLLAKVLEYM